MARLWVAFRNFRGVRRALFGDWSKTVDFLTNFLFGWPEKLVGLANWLTLGVGGWSGRTLGLPGPEPWTEILLELSISFMFPSLDSLCSSIGNMSCEDLIGEPCYSKDPTPGFLFTTFNPAEIFAPGTVVDRRSPDLSTSCPAMDPSDFFFVPPSTNFYSNYSKKIKKWLYTFPVVLSIPSAGAFTKISGRPVLGNW